MNLAIALGRLEARVCLFDINLGLGHIDLMCGLNGYWNLGHVLAGTRRLPDITLDGLVANEMAPRVHNSGHWTIEGAATSQFENHIRAVAGLPLGSTATVARSVTMTNIIGRDILETEQWLSQPDTHLHDYGKAEVREGRKMGHVTKLER